MGLAQMDASHRDTREEHSVSAPALIHRPEAQGRAQLTR